jgi:hypothetical protein
MHGEDQHFYLWAIMLDLPGGFQPFNNGMAMSMSTTSALIGRRPDCGATVLSFANHSHIRLIFQQSAIPSLKMV